MEVVQNKQKGTQTEQAKAAIRKKVKTNIIQKIKGTYEAERPTEPLHIIKRSRCFVFTYNNPPDEMSSDKLMSLLRKINTIRYLAFQLEIAPDTGTPHYQGYMEFNTAIRTTTLQNKLNKLDLKMTVLYRYKFSTGKQATKYCTSSVYKGKIKGKVEGTTRIWGEMIVQGQRTDLEAFNKLMKSGARLPEANELFPSIICRYPKYFGTLRKIYAKHMHLPNKVVIFCYGKSDKGKTTWARTEYPDAWMPALGGNPKFFSGYMGQDSIILDDYGVDGPSYALRVLLRITHDWSEKVETKFGETELTANTIIITSNYLPIDWYHYDEYIDKHNPRHNRISRWESYYALVRRITTVLWFDKKYKEPLEVINKWAMLYDINNTNPSTHKIPHSEQQRIITLHKLKPAKPNAFDELMAVDEELDIDTGNIVLRSEHTLYNVDDVEPAKVDKHPEPDITHRWDGKKEEYVAFRQKQLDDYYITNDNKECFQDTYNRIYANISVKKSSKDNIKESYDDYINDLCDEPLDMMNTAPDPEGVYQQTPEDEKEITDYVDKIIALTEQVNEMRLHKEARK